MKKIVTILLAITFSFGYSQTTVPQNVKITSVSPGVTLTSSNTKTIGVSSTTLAVTTTPYSVGDCLGGIITVTNTSRTSGGSSEIKTFSLWDKANQKASITVLFWKASPSGTYTDNSAMVITGDDPSFLGKIEILSSDYVTIGTNAVATIPVNLKIKPTTGTSIYYTMVTSSTSTFATNGLVSIISTEQD